MKRRWAIALLVAGLAVPVLAQVRGVPASVTSFSPMRSATPGVPASVTSLGPLGFQTPCSAPGSLIPSALGCLDPQFSNPRFGLSLNSNVPVNLHGRHRGFVPVFVPYAYPYPVVVQQVPVVVEPATDEDEDNGPPAPTIYERRSRTAPREPRPEPQDDSRYGAHERREPASEPPPATETRPAPEARPAADYPAVLLIFRDGHEREVKNYAIVGSTLYDLGMFVAGKIPLADLNLRATVKANEERGVEFTLPASVKLD